MGVWLCSLRAFGLLLVGAIIGCLLAWGFVALLMIAADAETEENHR